MPETALHHMIAALEIEVQAIKKHGGSRAIEVTGGEFRSATADNFIYAFPLSEEVHFRDDSPIKAVVGREESDGFIVSVSDGVLIVSLARNFGPRIPFARIVTDDSFLVEELKKRLEEVASGSAGFNTVTPDQVIGLRPVDTADAVLDDILLLGQPPLNPEQKAFVARALGSQVTFLWGPPGTGKTTTLARAVEGYYRAGLSVLVVSNTNVAVDTLLEKIADRLQTDEGFQRGAVLRYGPVAKPELKKYEGQVVVDKVVERLGASLVAEKSSLDTQRNQLLTLCASLQEAVSDYTDFAEAQSVSAHAYATLQRSETKQIEGQAVFNAALRQLGHLQQTLEHAKTLGTIRRFFSGLNVEQLQQQIAKTNTDLVVRKDLLLAITKEAADAKAAHQEAETRIAALRSRIATHPEFDTCKSSLANYTSDIDTISAKICAIEAQLNALRDEVLANCRVLATTVYRTYLKGQVARSFDVVVIDEASMLALPMTYYAAGLARRSVAVAGDFRQLPAIVVSDEPLAAEWLKQDVFHKAGIVNAINFGQQPDNLVALRIQYRMPDDICAVINDLFYPQNKLKTDASVRHRGKDEFPFGDAGLLYVDTSGYHPWAALRIGTYSRYNLLHAFLLRNIFCYLDDQGYLPPPNKPNRELGIVSPYSAQVRLVQRLLDEHLNGLGTRFAATVHGFQGNEKDTILLDLTDSPGARLSKFMRATSLEEDGARLLNVAASRARRHVVLVANFSYLLSEGNANSIAGGLIEHFRNRGAPLDAKELLSVGPEEWFDGLRAVELPQDLFESAGAGIFSEGTFYPAFIQDLEAATESIVVFSPFLTPQGISRWADAFRAKVSEGVAVRLVLRPPTDQGPASVEARVLVAELEALGAVVDYRASMHEKLAIIDGCVLWEGSLNIFSHRNTSEIMFRLPSGAACRQLSQFLTSSRGRKLQDEDEEVDLASRENPRCPECSGATVLLKDGRYVYFECEAECGGKVDPRHAGRRERHKPRVASGSGRHRSEGPSASGGICRECGEGVMVKRNGRHGPFLGCSNYPRCKHTESV
jgi:hypothetical protein